jgi:cellulose synthase/poly-beta-1,6-N-acetylglucosamine synthase-like glycosyltransferase
MIFSLIVTVFNDVEGTRKFLRRMEEQTRKPDEIVILDAGSKDGTWEALEDYARHGSIPVKLLRKERCKPAPSRNLCAKEASYDVLVVTDIGCDWERVWFEELIEPMEKDPLLDAVMGSWRVAWDDQKTEWAKADYFLQGGIELRATPTSLSANRAIVYKKEFYLGLGGLPEDLTFAGDDTLLARQIQNSGRRIAAASVPRCTWERPQTFGALVKESRRYARGAAEVGLGFRDFCLVATRLSIEVLMLMAGIIMLLLRMPTGGLLSLVAVALLVGSRLLKLRRRRDKRAKPRQTVSFWRLGVLEYATKMAGMRGWLEGFLYGQKHCQESRRKVRGLRSIA